MERIDQDLDLHAKKKKLLRLYDEQFLAGQTPDLPQLQLQLRELKLDKIELEIGRPRTEAYVVYVFLMLRGWAGGSKDQHARLLLEESMTLKLWLEHLWKSQPYRQARAERSAMESLVFTLKDGFEFGEMARRTHENVLAEMLEKVLAYNIFQIIRVRKKLSEPQEVDRAAA